ILSSWRWFDIDNLGFYLLHTEWQSDRRPTEKKIDNRVLDSYIGMYQEPDRSGAQQTNKVHAIGIRRKGDRLIAERKMVRGVWNIWLPILQDELLPESETSFSDRLGGCRITFSRDSRGNATGLMMRYPDGSFSCEKISNTPPDPPKPVKPHVPVKVDPKLLE